MLKASRASCLLVPLLALAAACAPTTSGRSPVPEGNRTAERTATGTAPVYSGTWTGVWIREDCKESGGAVGVACRSFPEQQDLQLRIDQTSGKLTGELNLGTLQCTVSGSVGTDGTLTLAGSSKAEAHTVTVSDWRSRLEQEQLTGTFLVTVTPDSAELGTMTVRGRLENVRKSGS